MKRNCVKAGIDPEFIARLAHIRDMNLYRASRQGVDPVCNPMIFWIFSVFPGLARFSPEVGSQHFPAFPMFVADRSCRQPDP